jgi:hypothetical protein
MQYVGRGSWLLGLLLLGLTLVVYWPGLSGGFLFDDYANIVSNPRVQPASLNWEALRTAASGYQPGMYGRPIATIWFAIDFLIGGKDPWTYKFSGLLVHLGNALLMFALVRRLLALPAVGMAPKWRVLAAAALAAGWALHPLQASTVLYIVQRMETLATTFILLALMAYLRGRLAQVAGQRGATWLWLAGLMTLLGMLCKESAILVPVFTLALELTVLRFGAQQAPTTRWLKRLYAAGVALAVAVFVLYVVPRFGTEAAYASREFNAYERLLTQLRILPLYLGQILVPLPKGMTFYYDNFPVSTGWLSPWTTQGGAALIALLLGSAWRWRTQAPLYALGVFWFFGAHAMTSNIIPLELVFEHRNYFALIGVLLALAEGIRRIPVNDRDGPVVKAVAVGVLLLGVGFLGMVRSATWGNELLLANDFAINNPGSARASSDVATLYVTMSDSNPDSPFYYLATLEFERGAQLPGASPLPEHGLLLMAYTTGGKVKDAWWDGLIRKLSTQKPGPQQRLAFFGLYNQYRAGLPIDKDRLSEAYRALLSRRQWPGYMYANYGEFLLIDLKDPVAAEQYFLKAVLANPRDTDLASRVVSNLANQGEEAIAQRVMEAFNAAARERAATR